MQPSTQRAWQGFINAAEREALTVEDMANLLHHQAYELVRDCCGPSVARKWQRETEKVTAKARPMNDGMTG